MIAAEVSPPMLYWQIQIMRGYEIDALLRFYFLFLFLCLSVVTPICQGVYINRSYDVGKRVVWLNHAWLNPCSYVPINMLLYPTSVNCVPQENLIFLFLRGLSWARHTGDSFCKMYHLCSQNFILGLCRVSKMVSSCWIYIELSILILSSEYSFDVTCFMNFRIPRFGFQFSSRSVPTD